MAMSAYPKRASEWAAVQNYLDFPVAHRSAVDGRPCACGGANGVALTVMAPHPDLPPASCETVALCLFQHATPIQTAACQLTPEAARELVNQLGAAIAAIEAQTGRSDDPVRRLLEGA
jgi:hypothetical protein